MSPRKLAWIVAGVLFAAASVAIHYEVKIGMHPHAGTVQSLGRVRVGEAAPDFSLQDLEGRPVSLSSFRREKAVLVDFWATWCGPCKAALPGLQELNDRFKDRAFTVVTVDQGEKADQVRYFIERKKYSFAVLLDQDNAVGNRYGVRGIPTSVFIDKQGIIRKITVGNLMDDDELQKQAERLAQE